MIERCAPAGEHEIELEVGDDVWGGEELESVEALAGDIADFQGGLGFAVGIHQPGVDEAEGFHKVCAGAAAGIEHDDAGIGEAIGEVEVFPEGLVGAGDHVFHDLRRGVPDAKGFPQGGIELG